MIKFKKILVIIAVIVLVFYVLSIRHIPSQITYGVSFSKFHSDELKLDWKETYLAILDDLGIKHLRLSAHWPNTEPQEDKYNFSELDFQLAEAERRGLDVILAVGRRLPGWPECHEPRWVRDQKSNIKNQNDRLKFQNEKVLKYIEQVVNRYKEFKSIKYWQVENEPFLTFFSRANCGSLDKKFLNEEIALVKKLDPNRPVLLTDSGEFGDWFRTYRRGDAFGSSLYLYIWNRKLGPLRYPITPAFFRIKQSLVELFFGPKPKMIIELSAEPWLLQPIVETPFSVQFERMGLDKFNEVIKFAAKTGFDKQYLWGAEWWYWLKQQGYPEHWERAQELF